MTAWCPECEDDPRDQIKHLKSLLVRAGEIVKRLATVEDILYTPRKEIDELLTEINKEC